MEIDPTCNPSLQDFAEIEASFFGRVAGPALLKNNRSEESTPLVQILSAAARTTDDAANLPELETALNRHGSGLHEIWPSLARHIARQAEDSDRELLSSLARDPFQVEDGPLRWALRYIVRGDVMLESGEVVTLDELCDARGEERLPYLEDPPEPLDVDWND